MNNKHIHKVSLKGVLSPHTLQCWEMKPGPHPCKVNALLLNYIPSPGRYNILLSHSHIMLDIILAIQCSEMAIL